MVSTRLQGQPPLRHERELAPCIALLCLENGCFKGFYLRWPTCTFFPRVSCSPKPAVPVLLEAKDHARVKPWQNVLCNRNENVSVTQARPGRCQMTGQRRTPYARRRLPPRSRVRSAAPPRRDAPAAARPSAGGAGRGGSAPCAPPGGGKGRAARAPSLSRPEAKVPPPGGARPLSQPEVAIGRDFV